MAPMPGLSRLPDFPGKAGLFRSLGHSGDRAFSLCPIARPGSGPNRRQVAVSALALVVGFFSAAPAAALTDREVDLLLDEGARMRALMHRMQTLNGPAPRPGAPGPELSAAAAPAPASAMLAAAQRERWFRSIERGVLGRFAADSETAGNDAAAPAAVGFVGGDEDWYGAVRVDGQERRALPTDPLDVQARVLVAPRFEDGSFFHVGVSYYSAGAPDVAEDFLALAAPAADDFRPGRYWGVDLGYAWDAYRVQAEYRQADAASGGGVRPPAVADPATDGFYVQGAWRIAGEPEAGRYAPGLLRHLTPRAESGIWELVVRYASLDPAAAAGAGRDSDSMLLGIHWRADSTLALELDYVEGNGEDFRALNDGGLTLRGTLSF